MGKRKRTKSKPDQSLHASRWKGWEEQHAVASSPIRLPYPYVRFIAGIIIVILAIVFRWQEGFDSPLKERRAVALQPITIPVPDYLGAQVCAECHKEENSLWRDSHHQKAMLPASEETVMGNFNDSSFVYADTTTTFFRREGRFMVRTDGPDGELEDYEIKYTFGVTPLQQYLIPLPGGRLQALGIAWDTRPKAQGGQRWFHLYPGQKVTHDHSLHWTGLNQNWNYMCAECHSTNVKKNYDASTRSYSTSYSEINVSCEACHGPGSSHVRWAKKEGSGKTNSDQSHRDDGSRGLVVTLDELKSVQWILNPETGNSRRSVSRSSTKEIEACGQCHSRRSPISEDYPHGRALGDTQQVALLEEGLYYPDGQMRDEVYVYGSFLQSKMFQQGVTCSDCHDPHTGHLRAPKGSDGTKGIKGEVCLRCHAAVKYRSSQHHFHPPESRGADCVACHMPTTTYMVVDPRHDHSFRVPRPDLSVKLGTPNACNQCHANRTSAWAAKQIERWYGHQPNGHQRFAEVLHDGSTGAPGAINRLLALAEDKSQPPIARASALAHVGQPVSPQISTVIGGQLDDGDALVRAAAVNALAGAEQATRLQLLTPLLRDPVRAVRIETARVLGDIPIENLAAGQRAALAEAAAEYEAAHRLNGDRPEAHLNLARLYSAQRKLDHAEASLRTALELDPRFVAASVNLADLYKVLDREAEGETVLQDALKHNPESAPLHHSLGLLRVRQKRTPEALAELKQATKLDHGNARYAYVYGVALNGIGESEKAIATLRDAVKRHPFDRDILFALAAICRDHGKVQEAISYARVLAELEPQNPKRIAFMDQLQEEVTHKRGD